jgi:hypothetical protein
MHILGILGIDRKSRRIVIIFFSPKFSSTMLVWEYYPQGRQVTSISYFVQYLFSKFLHIIRVIHYHNGAFCQELVPYDISKFVLHTMSINSSPLCILGGCVWIWMKSILFQFIEGHTCFSSSWHAKMSWSSMNQQWMFFVQSSTLPPSMHRKSTEHGRHFMQKNQRPIKTHVELEDNSIRVILKYDSSFRPTLFYYQHQFYLVSLCFLYLKFVNCWLLIQLPVKAYLSHIVTHSGYILLLSYFVFVFSYQVSLQNVADLDPNDQTAVLEYLGNVVSVWMCWIKVDDLWLKSEQSHGRRRDMIYILMSGISF